MIEGVVAAALPTGATTGPGAAEMIAGTTGTEVEIGGAIAAETDGATEVVAVDGATEVETGTGDSTVAEIASTGMPSVTVSNFTCSV